MVAPPLPCERLNYEGGLRLYDPESTQVLRRGRGTPFTDTRAAHQLLERCGKGRRACPALRGARAVPELAARERGGRNGST